MGKLDLVTLRGQRYLELVDGVRPQVRDRREMNNRLKIEAMAEGKSSVVAERGGRQVVDNGTSHDGSLDGDYVAEIVRQANCFALYVHDVDTRGKVKRKIEIRFGRPGDRTDGLIPEETVRTLLEVVEGLGYLHCYLWDNSGRGNLVVLDHPGANLEELPYHFPSDGEGRIEFHEM